jgi:hypothetical protein
LNYPNGKVIFFKTLEIGVGLTIFGVIFIIMGIILFFDSGLLAMGNVINLLKNRYYFWVVYFWVLGLSKILF